MFGEEDAAGDGVAPVIDTIEKLKQNEQEFTTAFQEAEGGVSAEDPKADEPFDYTVGDEPHVVTVKQGRSITDVSYHTSDGVLIVVSFFGELEEQRKAAGSYAQFIAASFGSLQEQATVRALDRDRDLRAAMNVGTSPADPIPYDLKYGFGNETPPLAWGFEPEDAMRMQAVRDAFQYGHMRPGISIDELISAAGAFEQFYTHGGEL